MKLMAIDPGLKGGIALFDSDRLYAIDPMTSGKMQYGGRGKQHRLISLAWLRQVIASTTSRRSSPRCRRHARSVLGRHRHDFTNQPGCSLWPLR
jgi:hypothetical protein